MMLNKILTYPTSRLSFKLEQVDGDTKINIFLDKEYKNSFKVSSSVMVFFEPSTGLLILSSVEGEKAYLNTVYRSLKNLFEDLLCNFSIILKFKGSNMRLLEINDDHLVLELAYSHLIKFKNLGGLTIEKISKDGSTVKVTGNERIKVLNFVTKLKSLRPPNSFTGAGIHLSGEVFKVKERKKDD